MCIINTYSYQIGRGSNKLHRNLNKQMLAFGGAGANPAKWYNSAKHWKQNHNSSDFK